MSRRVFTREFKIAAVKLIVEDKMDVKDVSKQLGVHANSLYRWVQEFEENGESAFPGKGCKIYDYQAEIYFFQYGKEAVILSPEFLRDRMIRRYRDGLRRYR